MSIPIFNSYTMKESEITDEQIKEEIKEVLLEKKLRVCAQCTHASADMTFCTKYKKPFISKLQYAGNCNEYITNEELVIRKTREKLKQQERQERKANHLITMCLNCIEASMLFLEDFNERIEREYKFADIVNTGNPAVRKADRQWIANLKRANKEMIRNIEGAMKQYNHYVMPIFNKVFLNKESGEYDVEQYDDHMSDSWELAHLVLRYFDVAYMNPENAEAIIEHMKQMKSCGVMEDMDYIRYNYRR